MNMKTCLLMMFLCFPAWGQSWKSIKVQPLTELRSSQGSEITFAKEVGQYMSRYSGRTGYEACAEICRSSQGQWAAFIGTIGSHSSCKIEPHCPAGFKPIDKTIHSHPTEKEFVANSVDFMIWEEPYQENHRVKTDDPKLFSESDFLRPGYLVVYGQLYFQSGPHAIVELGSIQEP